MLTEFVPLIKAVDTLPEDAFPIILHLALLKDSDRQELRNALSTAISRWFQNFDIGTLQQAKAMLNAILYLRKKEIPNEVTKAERFFWLDIDYALAAEVAAHCSMFKTSLLLLEFGHSEGSKGRASRRASAAKQGIKTDLVLQIYQNLDEKDSFYGIRQPSTLAGLTQQLEFENAGFASLSFRSAYYDGQLRNQGTLERSSEEGMIALLDNLDLNGLSHAVLSSTVNAGGISPEAAFQTARKLERWDVSTPAEGSSQSVTLFKVFKGISGASGAVTVTNAINSALATALGCLTNGAPSLVEIFDHLDTLSVLTELDDLLSSRGLSQAQEILSLFQLREGWMETQRYVPDFVANIDTEDTDTNTDCSDLSG